MIKGQKQESGDSSTNLQAQAVTINQGISYSDAKAIALDVFKANMLQLSEDAAKLAQSRAEELSDNFLKKLKEENEEAIKQMNQPGMQSALFEAQKQYAKTGDKDLEELLVDILVERTSTTKRNIHQIVLDEALEVASKLTTEQMDTLTITFLITQTKKGNLINLETLVNYINNEIIPFSKELTNASSCYEHLAYTGCISLMETSSYKPIEELLKNKYQGLFSNGFDDKKFKIEVGNIDDFNDLLMPCLHFPNLKQFKAIDIDVLKNMCDEKNIDNETSNKFINLLNTTLMNNSQIKDFLLKEISEIDNLFKLWDESTLSKFKLTTVGIAVAQANFRRRTNQKLDLSIWVK